MTFLTPYAAVTAAIIALPVLLLLYFLKLRRQPRHIASTLLWLKSVEDLQVNAPFQRLKLTFLFLIQLLILLLLILALGRPTFKAAGMGDATRMILLIDRSASMNAKDDGKVSRLELAKIAAKDIASSLGDAEQPGQLMVIAFSRTAQVVSSFQSDTRALMNAIDSIESTDESANLASALKLADAFAASMDAESANLPVVLLLSDGSINTSEAASEESDLTVRTGEFRYVRIGPESTAQVNNIGIASIGARRDIDDVSIVNVFVRLVNASVNNTSVTLTVRVDEKAVASSMVEVPAATEENFGELLRAFKIPLAAGGVLTVGHTLKDALDEDNIVSLVVPPPTAPRVAIVFATDKPDPFLAGIMEATDPEELRTIGITEYQQLVASAEPLPFDLIAFDHIAPATLPDLPLMIFGATMSGIEIIEPSRVGGRRFISWDRRHRLMRHVELDNVVFSNFGAFDIPEEMADKLDVLATGADGPVIISIKDSVKPQVFVGFDLFHSNWPTGISLLVFLQNILDEASLSRGGEAGLQYQPGDTIVVHPETGIKKISVAGPISSEINVEDRSSVTLPVLRYVGLYSVIGALSPHNMLAVNLVNAGESDIRPNDEVTVNASAITGGNVDEAASRELWPWFVAAVFVLLTLEWLVYTSRTKI